MPAPFLFQAMSHGMSSRPLNERFCVPSPSDEAAWHVFIATNHVRSLSVCVQRCIGMATADQQAIRDFKPDWLMVDEYLISSLVIKYAYAYLNTFMSLDMAHQNDVAKFFEILWFEYFRNANMHDLRPDIPDPHEALGLSATELSDLHDYIAHRIKMDVLNHKQLRMRQKIELTNHLDDVSFAIKSNILLRNY
jgi:hypothetical protein